MDKLKPLAHAALDKQLSSITRFSKQLSLRLDINSLFNIEDIPTVFFSKRAYSKLAALTTSCPKEIGWHCTVEKEILDDGSETYTVTDTFVYPQEVTGGTTKATDDCGMWYMKQPDEVFNHLRMQGHSHVDFGVTPSPTDRNYYAKLIEGVKDFYIFFIINKRGEVWIELHDMVRGIIYEESDLVIIYEDDPVDRWAEIQIDKHLDLGKENQPVSVTKFTDQQLYELEQEERYTRAVRRGYN